MVDVAPHHPRHPVDERREVARVVGDPVGVGVGLDVGLVDDVQAEFVGEVEQRRVVRVVRGADRVEAEPLDQREVGAQLLRAQHPAGVRVEVVPVHPPQVDPPAVDQQVGAGDLDRAEADPVRRLLHRYAVRVVQRDRELVQHRGLRGPGPHAGHRGRHPQPAGHVRSVEPRAELVLRRVARVDAPPASRRPDRPCSRPAARSPTSPRPRRRRSWPRRPRRPAHPMRPARTRTSARYGGPVA